MRGVILLLAVAVAAVTAVTGWRQATAPPAVVRYDVAVAGWPAGAVPLRLVQLSDVHLGPPDMPATRVAAIVAAVNALAPDVVVMTGDYHGGKWSDGASGNLDDAVRPYAALRSRYGTFAVRGNHDEPYWSPRVLPRHQMTYLQNAHADAGPVTIAGIDDLSTGHPGIAAALAGIAPDRPVILLMHEPASFADVPARVALSLAGHTHGGQIRLPLIGSPWLPAGSGGYVRGAYRRGSARLIVSSGVGTTLVPLRLGVPPEIVVVTLHR